MPVIISTTYTSLNCIQCNVIKIVVDYLNEVVSFSPTCTFWCISMLYTDTFNWLYMSIDFEYEYQFRCTESEEKKWWWN